MALIPPDAGVRLRMQTEASLLQPLAPVKEVPSDLPELQPGQAFSARIQEALPENTYKALVAGRLLTLQLPEGAKAGDTLELVVIDRTPRALIAERVAPQTGQTVPAEPYPYASLSRTGQMIGQLLLPEGETPKPAALNRNEPLLAQTTPRAADLAPALAKAVGESGLFYESHQAQWIAGQRPVQSLMAEPQARQAESASTFSTSRPEAAATGIAGGGQPVPDELRPLVQQQLDAIATQRLAWHGEVWPGQFMNLEIERERVEDDARGAGTEEPDRWSTTLRLTMPRLGSVDATLQLVGNGLRLRLAAGEEGTATDLRTASPQLAEALSAAGLPLVSFEVRNEPR